jgi:rsbT antagonist protein RsbS
MAVSLLKQGDLLIATVQDALTDAELDEMQSRLLEQVGAVRARGVILDITALDVVDSYAARMIRATTHMLKLRGATTVVVGIQPDVAFAMVQLGLQLDGVHTALDLDEGLVYMCHSHAGSARRA